MALWWLRRCCQGGSRYRRDDAQRWIFQLDLSGRAFRALLGNGQGRRGRAVTAIVVRTDHYESGVEDATGSRQDGGADRRCRGVRRHQSIRSRFALELAGLNPATDVRWQTSASQPDIVKQLGQKQVDVADIAYHLAYRAQQQGFCRIILSRDEILPNSQTRFRSARDEMLEVCR